MSKEITITKTFRPSKVKTTRTSISVSGGSIVIDGSSGGTGDVTKAYVDGSLGLRDTSINWLRTKTTQIDASLNNTFTLPNFVKEASLGSKFLWTGGFLDVSVAGGTGDVTKAYVDGSLGTRDTRLSGIDASLNNTVLFSAVDLSINSFTASASADVTMTNASQWYTGTSFNLTAGTWLVMGHITMARTATTATRYSAKIDDASSNNYASASQYAPSVNPHYISISLSAIVTLPATRSVRLNGLATQTNCVIKAAVVDGASGNNATMLNAIKIKP